jgi:hypothetical protein
MIKVEYLLPFNTEGGICRDISSFNSLLESHSDITITSTKLRYKKSNYNYSVSMNEVPNQDCTVFHVILEINHITNKFREMLKSFKRTVGVHLKDDIQIIWDGVSFEWSKELYPRIYQIENLMRKLISKFMLINLGIGWHKSAIPSEVKKSMKTTNGKASHGILYEVDFIQLAHFLFKQYAIKDASKLPVVITDALDGELTEEKRSEILDFIPKNNWDRYISQIVQCESEQLKKKWEKLYEIRCKVAHNISMLETDFEDGNTLCEFLESILQSAFDSLNNVEIPEDELENISLNTIATVHEPTRGFINDYLNFNNGLTGVINLNRGIFKSINEYTSPISAILNSSNIGTLNISESLKSSLDNIMLTKNSLLTSESFANLNSITENYSKLFSDASLGIVKGFENIIPSDEISKYLTISDIYSPDTVTDKDKDDE